MTIHSLLCRLPCECLHSAEHMALLLQLCVVLSDLSCPVNSCKVARDTPCHVQACCSACSIIQDRCILCWSRPISLQWQAKHLTPVSPAAVISCTSLQWQRSRPSHLLLTSPNTLFCSHLET